MHKLLHFVPWRPCCKAEVLNKGIEVSSVALSHDIAYLLEV